MSGDARKRRLTTDDAISYVGVEMVTLKDEEEKYNYFLDLMADVGANRFDYHNPSLFCPNKR